MAGEPCVLTEINISVETCSYGAANRRKVRNIRRITSYWDNVPHKAWTYRCGVRKVRGDYGVPSVVDLRGTGADDVHCK